ncbi:MAG TPA: hypothetical protein VF941_24590 [Clostridia bacterium]
MKHNDFLEFYNTSMDLFGQGNHAGINGNKIVDIFEKPSYPAFNSRLWEMYDSGVVAFYEWYIPDDVFRFEFCIEKGLDFRRHPSIEGKVIEVNHNTFEKLTQTLSWIYKPDKYPLRRGLDGIVTSIYFNQIEKGFSWCGDSIPQGLEQIHYFSLELKSCIEKGDGKGFSFGIEGKLYAEFLSDNIDSIEMEFIKSFSYNIMKRNFEIKEGNRMLLSNSFDKEHFEVIMKEKNFRSFRLIYEELI